MGRQTWWTWQMMTTDKGHGQDPHSTFIIITWLQMSRVSWSIFSSMMKATLVQSVFREPTCTSIQQAWCGIRALAELSYICSLSCTRGLAAPGRTPEQSRLLGAMQMHTQHGMKHLVTIWLLSISCFNLGQLYQNM
jgi:hypothetical protein